MISEILNVGNKMNDRKKSHSKAPRTLIVEYFTYY